MVVDVIVDIDSVDGFNDGWELWWRVGGWFTHVDIVDMSMDLNIIMLSR